MGLFDRFISKTTAQIVDQCTVHTAGTADPLPATYGGQYTGTGGAGQTSNINTGAFWTGGSAGSGMSIGQNIFMSGSNLTDEEAKELKTLEEERAASIKLKKIEIFKELPASLRQKIVDDIEWRRAVQKMNSASADNNDRYNDLSGKRGVSLSGYVDMGGFMYEPQPTIPNGITEGELISAHNEKALEEQIIGDGDEPNNI